MPVLGGKPTTAHAPQCPLASLCHRPAKQPRTQAAAAGPPQAYASMIPETLEEMEADEDFQQTLERMAQFSQQELTAQEASKREAILQDLGVPPWKKVMKDQGVSPAVRSEATTLQLNIGLYCNQACSHCHVESSPKRTETMSHETAQKCLQLLRNSPNIRTLDITGGAPELNPEFKFLVEEASQLGVEIIDRCNLTVLLEPGQEQLAEFLAAHKVRVVASLPCYSKENVDGQRGGGVFRRSISGLQKLNAAGYGKPGTGLSLDLVYNPGGPFLSPSQAELEPAYKRELKEGFDIDFNTLLCLNNMPIKRYWEWLERHGELQQYMKTLVDGFNPAAGEAVMCRDTVSVAWDGHIYDCDFNQQLALPMQGQPTVFNLNSLEDLTGRPIACGSHCFGCTAGSGSSCQGQ